MVNFDNIFTVPVDTPPEKSQHNNNNPNWAEEQKAAREQLYELADTMASTIRLSGDKYKEYLDVQSKFEHYSATNALLILSQRPDATRLKSRADWKDIGYTIQDKKTIQILQPGKSYQRDDESYGTYYNVRNVYDITQTDAQVPNIPEKKYDDKLLLSSLISKRPVPIELVDDMTKGAIYDDKAKKIFVRKGMDAPDLFRSVSLAIAKATMAQYDNNTKQKNTALQAYSISYMLCKKYGIDVDKYDFRTVPTELKDIESKDFRIMLNEIRNTFKTISGRIERAIEQQHNHNNKSQER